jgi:hypothetical protein
VASYAPRGNFDAFEKNLTETIAPKEGMETSEVEDIIFGAERSSISQLYDGIRLECLNMNVPLTKS